MSRGARGVAVVCITVLQACGTREATDALEPLVLTDDDIHVVGTSEEIARIEDLMPAADGAVWALNNTEPFLVLLSAEGETVRVHGERGEGPGELSWPSTLVRNPSTDRLWVFDASLGRLALVPEPGDAPETLSLAGDSTAPVRLNSYEWLWTNNGGRTWLAGTQDGFVYARPSPGLGWMLSLWSTEVVRVDYEGQAQPVLSTASIVGDPSERFGDAQRFLPYPIWAACPSGSLAVYDPNRNVLRRFGAGGEPRRVHDLPPERQVRITAERIFDTVYPGILRNRLMVDPPEPEAMREMFQRDYERTAGDFADAFPEYVHLDCARGDTLWLQRFDPTAGRMGRGPTWRRVTTAGEAGEVRFPSNFRPMRFVGDRIWGVHTGELDVEHAAWTELPG